MSDKAPLELSPGLIMVVGVALLVSLGVFGPMFYHLATASNPDLAKPSAETSAE